MQPPKNILKSIQQSNSFLAHAHLGPDPDSIGSILALKLGLEALDKKLDLHCEDDIPDTFLFLPQAKSISQQDFADIPQDQYDVYLSLDTATFRLATHHRPLPPEFTIPLINIDHHPDNDIDTDLTWLEPSASSTAEMVYYLLKALKVTITPDIATCLLFGILGDTSTFQNINTTPEALRLTADLVSAGGDYQNCITHLSYSRTPEELKAWSIAIDNLHLSPSGDFAIISLGPDDWKRIKTDVSPGLLANSLVRSIAGTKFGVVLSEKAPGVTKGSLRSRLPDYDVSFIAHQFGGGGHQAAAGIKIDKPLKEAEQEFIGVVQMLDHQ